MRCMLKNEYIHTYIKWWQCSVTAAFVSFAVNINGHFFHFSFSTSWSLVIPKGSLQLSLPVLSQRKSFSITVKRFSSINFEISVIHLCFRVRSTYLEKHLLVSSARAWCKIKDWLPCTKPQKFNVYPRACCWCHWQAEMLGKTFVHKLFQSKRQYLQSVVVYNEKQVGIIMMWCLYCVNCLCWICIKVEMVVKM